MSLKQRIASRAAGMVKEEITELPDMEGEKVLVRGLMLGQQTRIIEQGMDAHQNLTSKGFVLVIGLTSFDPETGKLIWNPNAQEDADAINALPPTVGQHLVKVAFRLSGMNLEAGQGDAAGNG